MDNKTIARTFRLYGQLMELHGENPFRTKAITSLAFKLDKFPFALNTLSTEALSELPGIGKSTAQKITALLQRGAFDELDALQAATPDGILEMLRIKGLGAKKTQVIWRALGIESMGELYYACNENRLVTVKGFGLKTQEEIKKIIEFSMANRGWFLYASIENTAEGILEQLRQLLPPETLIAYTGDFRRKNEILQSVDIIAAVERQQLEQAIARIATLTTGSDHKDTYLEATDNNGLLFRFLAVTAGDFHQQWLISTGAAEHVALLEQAGGGQLPKRESETAIYRALGFDYIEPELREGGNELDLAKSGALPTLITYRDLRGALHNHSTYSDGVNTLEEMALYCRDVLKLDYLGICDHSKTAVYANGLPIARIQEQWAEIEALNHKLAPFRIFKGIESDILSDGSLDYPDEILAGFDFVVASIHGNLKMEEEKATHRLLKAIENPYTTILGHPTGRLLLSRPGYPIDYRRVIDACAEHGVVMEINANPLRLDLDWRWHRYALEKNVLLSINPDAHRVSGFHDMQYGIYAARKGGVASKNCLNAFSLAEISAFFQQRSQRASLLSGNRQFITDLP
ncbi:helix-hairpin-helix domain-containing protein [Parapedobacter lycopersici]|uniref:helix-hairpin-helix domain-containing protein n=1 Tax=Parapedobacter lycopersici TaxID=1864939 RepID=UPI0033428057